MNHITLLKRGWMLLLFALPVSLASYGQAVFEEEFTNGIPATWTIQDVDGQTPDPNVAQFTDAWIGAADFDNTTDTVAMSTSWYSPPGTADDWLMTPAVNLTSNNIIRWEEEAQDANYTDGYELYITTAIAGATPTPADFLGANGAMIFTTPGASGAVWTEEMVDLQALGYNNQTVYFAWRNNSNNQFVLMINNVFVGVPMIPIQFDASVEEILVNEYTQMKLSHNNPIEFGGEVKSLGVGTITNVVVTVDVFDGPTLVHTASSAPIGSIPPGDSASFTIPPYVPIDTGVHIINYSVALTENDTVTTNNSAITGLFISPTIYARDNGNVIGSLGIGAGNGGELGQDFEIPVGDSLTSVQFRLNNTSILDGQMVYATVREMVADSPTTALITTDTFTIDTSIHPTILNLELDIAGGAVFLPAGRYAITINEPDDTSATAYNVALAYTSAVHTPNTTHLDWPTNPQGAWSHNEDFNFPFSYLLRANFDPQLPPPPPTCTLVIDTATSTNISCNGAGDGTAMVMASGGIGMVSYNWNNGDTTAMIDSLSASSYVIIVNDSLGCADTATVVVTEPALMSISGSTTQPTCPGDQGCVMVMVDSGAQGAVNFLWSTGDTTAQVCGLVGGAYSVVVTDAAGCTANFTVSLIDATPMAISFIGTPPTCLGSPDGQVEAEVTLNQGPVSYLWSNGDTTATADDLLAGDVWVTVTDSAGCTASDTTTLLDPVQMVINFTETPISCNGEADGGLVADVSFNQGPVTYVWSHSAAETTNTVTGLVASNYTLTVTDSAGCLVSASALLGEPDALVASTTGTDVTIMGGTDGSATATVTGGTPPYTYLWDDPNAQTTDAATGLAAGTYEVTVTDSNGCTTTATQMVADGPNSIFDPVSGISINAYPNPIVNNLRLSIMLTSADEVNLQVLNPLGQVIYTYNQSNVTEMTHDIASDEWASGIYHVVVSTNAGKVTYKVTK